MYLSLKTNPAKMMQKLNDVKKEYSTLVEEAASIQKAQQVLLIYGPGARKSVFGGSDQIRFKPACSATEAS